MSDETTFTLAEHPNPDYPGGVLGLRVDPTGGLFLLPDDPASGSDDATDGRTLNTMIMCMVAGDWDMFPPSVPSYLAAVPRPEWNGDAVAAIIGRSADAQSDGTIADVPNPYAATVLEALGLTVEFAEAGTLDAPAQPDVTPHGSLWIFYSPEGGQHLRPIPAEMLETVRDVLAEIADDPDDPDTDDLFARGHAAFLLYGMPAQPDPIVTAIMAGAELEPAPTFSVDADAPHVLEHTGTPDCPACAAMFESLGLGDIGALLASLGVPPVDPDDGSTDARV